MLSLSGFLVGNGKNLSEFDAGENQMACMNVCEYGGTEVWGCKIMEIFWRVPRYELELGMTQVSIWATQSLDTMLQQSGSLSGPWPLFLSSSGLRFFLIKLTCTEFLLCFTLFTNMHYVQAIIWRKILQMKNLSSEKLSNLLQFP